MNFVACWKTCLDGWSGPADWMPTNNHFAWVGFILRKFLQVFAWLSIFLWGFFPLKKKARVIFRCLGSSPTFAIIKPFNKKRNRIIKFYDGQCHKFTKFLFNAINVVQHSINVFFALGSGSWQLLSLDIQWWYLL